MENMTFQAHFDGAQILLDDPIKLVANTKLLVTVLEPSVEPEHSLASRQ